MLFVLDFPVLGGESFPLGDEAQPILNRACGMAEAMP
jgi:hypothetical protein